MGGAEIDAYGPTGTKAEQLEMLRSRLRKLETLSDDLSLDLATALKDEIRKLECNKDEQGEKQR